ncbi:SDR family NAD(P)-dependent oxidoreductase [Treponema zuelzerae]|uniref:SDR family NAD(P)-dependent oxidoreductase n=1 Tax=Teretinema zuelzerae TaxID=156 RepID=A0AAE3EHT4_9SPIR|nr:SDR family NAD(P)-dependent oxidoreductase [Teretinema zuelzerae]MCD1653114.1 SDR family NAD(P)-dependent oxidoreductase [Teretinema zuelzerae]MCD1654465.1 SDR family NAD(P)-dependent oxidoreductase [Teretinema zuelzerae]
MKQIAIVTGASSGMGSDFARQIDGREGIDEIWLVARRRARLESLAGELKNARAVIIEADLSTDEGISIITAKLAAEKPSVRILVNNAGYGKIGNFSDLSRGDNLGMVDLNVRTLTALTYDALPYMATGSSIIQVASLAAFLPISTMAVYAASKSYVLSFSEALAVELEARGISVTALCPGPVATEFFEIAANKKDHGMKGLVPSSLVVSRALKAAEKGKAAILPTAIWKLTAFFTRFAPRKFLARAAGRMM